MDMGGYVLMGASGELLSGDAGDIRYPYFLINGRRASAPPTCRGKPGTRLRLRIINAGGDTAFRLALGGHKLTVTHTDGFPVKPVQTDAVLIGMGERYDALVTIDGGVPSGRFGGGQNATAMAVIRTGARRIPAATGTARRADRPGDRIRRPDPCRSGSSSRSCTTRTIRLGTHRRHGTYNWAINGEPFSPDTVTAIRTGERVQVDYANTTTMRHPMHLHGHTFPPARPSSQRHRHGASQTDPDHGLRRRQPGYLDDPLPPHLPRRGRHDDPGRLPNVADGGGDASRRKTSAQTNELPAVADIS